MMVTTTVYKGRLSTRPNARIVMLTDEEYARLRKLDEAEAIEKRSTVRIEIEAIRELLASAGWEVPQSPKPPKPWSTLPPFVGFALLGVAVGVVLVLLYRMP